VRRGKTSEFSHYGPCLEVLLRFFRGWPPTDPRSLHFQVIKKPTATYVKARQSASKRVKARQSVKMANKNNKNDGLTT
jgi:hypothetical protein